MARNKRSGYHARRRLGGLKEGLLAGLALDIHGFFVLQSFEGQRDVEQRKTQPGLVANVQSSFET